MAKTKDILENFSEKFPILNRVYGLYQQMAEISRNEENTLRKSAEITVLEILELIVIATRQAKNEKVLTLRQATRKLDTLKVFTDMAKEYRSIPEARYSQIQEVLQSTGKMLGGWLKSAANPAPTAK